MQRAAMARGYDLSDLRARLFTAADFDRFDLIIGMDRDNIADIESLRPAGNQTPVKLFSEYSKRPGTDVPDPYYTREFDKTLDMVEVCAKGLLATLPD